MTIAEFVSQHRRSGESVAAIADMVTRVSIEDDDEFVAAAKALMQAEDKFYVMMLERGLER